MLCPGGAAVALSSFVADIGRAQAARSGILIWAMVLGLLALVLLLPSFGAYLLHHLCVTYLARPRNLKQAYKAQWALVTGASSGESACSLYSVACYSVA